MLLLFKFVNGPQHYSKTCPLRVDVWGNKPLDSWIYQITMADKDLVLMCLLFELAT